MRIAFLLGNINGKGGIARAVSIVAEYLSRDDSKEIFIINYCVEKADNKHVLNTAIRYLDIFDKQVNMKKGFFKARNIVHKYLKKNEIDVLISCGALYFILGVMSAKGLKTKTVAWEHSNYTAVTGHAGKKYTRKFGARMSDFVITLTKTDQKNYLKNIRKDNVEYIYSPVDPLLMVGEDNYNPNEKKIVTVANFNPVKNYKDLIKVAVDVFSDEKFSDWQWDIYGDGSEREEIENLIKKNGLNGKVILKGRVNNIYDLLNDYSIYVCTSKSEGLPMALIEAKAKKLPIVSFDIMTGPREIITDDKNGFLVEPYNIEIMVSKLKILMCSAEKRKEFSENAYIGIEQFYVSECVAKWNKVIKNLS